MITSSNRDLNALSNDPTTISVNSTTVSTVKRSTIFSSPSGTKRTSIDIEPTTRASISENTKISKQEGFYFTYLRVGNIKVNVSTAGFTFNLDNYNAMVEEYVKRGEVMTWSKFVVDFEYHAW
jgi:thiamine pyrophosphokinase